MRSSGLEHLRLWSIGLAWPVSAVYNVGLVEILRACTMVLPIFAVLLLLTGSFGWARMIRALFISLVLFAIGDLAVFSWLSGHGVVSYSEALAALVFKGSAILFRTADIGMVNLPIACL